MKYSCPLESNGFDKLQLKYLGTTTPFINPAAAAGLPRHPLGGGGIKLPLFMSAKISSQRVEIEKQNFAHIFLNT